MFVLICLTLSFLLYFGYIAYVRIKYKPDCISESYYLLKNGNIFTIWMVLVAFSIFPAWVEISEESYEFLPFLSMVALMLVGICPKYLERDRIPHIAGASMTCILSLIWNIASGTLIVPSILLIIVILIFTFNVKDKLFWIECLAFINIYMSILLKISLVL